MFRVIANGAKTDRAQLRKMFDQFNEDDVLTVTSLDHTNIVTMRICDYRRTWPQDSPTYKATY